MSEEKEEIVVEDIPQKTEEKAPKKKSTEKAEGKKSKVSATDKLAAELADVKDSLLRTAAEYENFRRRSAKEKESSFSNGISTSVTALLPVIDTLEMATLTPTEDENYKKGVEMTLAQCATAFAKLGVQEILSANEPFNPELHSAVMQEETEGVESGIITKVLQKGYSLKGKVIRHATVVVAV